MNNLKVQRSTKFTRGKCYRDKGCLALLADKAKMKASGGACFFAANRLDRKI